MSDALDRALAAIALAEFERRRAAATRKVAAGEMRPGDANGLLMPWLALACRAGVDLPELAELLAERLAIPGSRNGRFYTESQARVSVADSLCPIAQIRASLDDAREDALERHEAAPDDAALLTRARGLCTLASAFGVPMRWRPTEPQMAAA